MVEKKTIDKFEVLRFLSAALEFVLEISTIEALQSAEGYLAKMGYKPEYRFDSDDAIGLAIGVLHFKGMAIPRAIEEARLFLLAWTNQRNVLLLEETFNGRD